MWGKKELGGEILRSIDNMGMRGGRPVYHIRWGEGGT